MALPDGLEHLAFKGPESLFALLLEKVRNRTTGRFFDDVVSIHESITELLRQGTAAAALAAAHHPHQIEVPSSQSGTQRVGSARRLVAHVFSVASLDSLGCRLD